MTPTSQQFPVTPPAPIMPILEPHQQQTVDFLATHPFGGSWLDMGGGKTLSTLMMLMKVMPRGHILVTAPVNIARSTWIDEIEQWNIPIRTKSLIVNERDKKLPKAKRLEAFQQVFNDPPTMYFINQELISRAPMANCTTCGGNGLKGRACTDCQTGLVDQMPIQKVTGLDGKKRDTIIWPFQTVIIDESQGFKSHSSRRFKALASVRPAMTRVVELTGTPSPNGLEDLWAQMYLLDQGQALGANITAFRNRWFTAKMIPGTTTPAKWVPNPNAETEIHQAISHLVMSAKNTTLILPERRIEDVRVSLPGDLLDKYRAFKRDLVLDVVNKVAIRLAEDAYETWLQGSSDPEAQAIRDDLDTLSGDDLAEATAKYRDDNIDAFATVPGLDIIKTVIAANPAVLTSKLMQYASGTLYTADADDPSTKGDYEIIHDQKIEMTEYLIRNNGNRPVLLAYHFGSDKKELVKHFKKAKIDAQVFDGSREMVQRWNAKQIPVMLIHPASAGHGLNLQYGGSTMIWYTLPFSLEHYMQTNKRLHRPGQAEPVTIYRLLTRGTQDERMPGVLMDKQNTQDRLIQAVSADHSLEDAVLGEIDDDLDEIYQELGDDWTLTRL